MGDHARILIHKPQSHRKRRSELNLNLKSFFGRGDKGKRKVGDAAGGEEVDDNEVSPGGDDALASQEDADGASSSSSSGGSSSNNNSNSRNNVFGLGGVAGIVDSMGNLKNSQRTGKMTSSLVQELASTTVEGVAQDGKIKILFDCQQRPVSVKIDESYFEDQKVQPGAAVDMAAAIQMALQDGHAKSLEKMDEKMKSLYAELGLP